MERIFYVGDLVKELRKLDQNKLILIGDDDEYSRLDVAVEKIVKKHYGFDENNEEYYVLAGATKYGGCIKY